MIRRRTAPRAPRVVLDTNVVVSALVFGGAIAKLRDAWQTGACIPLVNHVTAHELVRVLAYPKFRLDAREREDLLADYLPYSETVRMPPSPPVVPACRDVFDLPFLELALAGEADTLVSGDRDLLALSGRAAFAVLAPEAFVVSLAKPVATGRT
jgi:putative PIN family toxin of toxin-antitoxin system